MNRKLTIGWVLVLALMLLTLTAVAVELLTGMQIIEQIAVPMARQNDAETYTQESYSHEELTQLLKTLKENGITLEEDSRIMKALENGQGYWEEEVLMAICREAFGGSFSTWTIEEKHWFDSMTVQIGFKEKNPYLVPGEDDMSVPQAKAHAVQLLKEAYGVELPVLSDDRWMIWEWFYAPWTDTKGHHPALWTFEFVNRNSMSVEYTVRFERDGGAFEVDRAYFLEDEIEAASYDQIDRYMSDKYGAMPLWPVSAWAEFGQLLAGITPQSRNQWCWQQAGYCLPPEGAIPPQEAVSIAQADIAIDGTCLPFVICCNVDQQMLYKVTLSIHAPGNEGNAKYDAIWCLEMDCMTGKITGRQEYRYDGSTLLMYVPFAVIERAPAFSEPAPKVDASRTALKQQQAEAYSQYQQTLGENWYFWPLEAQQAALGGRHSVPKTGEMSREEAVEAALQAIREQQGSDALQALGEYHTGAICCRYQEPEGTRISWEIYITSDPQNLSNGYRVNFDDPSGLQSHPDVIVTRANAGNG